MKKSNALYASMSQNEKILGTIWLVVQLFLPYLMKLLNGYLPNPMGTGMLTFVRYLVNFVVICCIFHSFLRNSLTAAWRGLWNVVQAVVLGFVAHWACSRLIDWLMSYILPSYSTITDASIAALSQTNNYLMIIGVVILAPVIEETLYRGLIYRNLWKKSRVAAYIVSMLVFSAVHVLGYIGTEDITTMVLCFIRYLPAGLCLAWTYSKADNLFAPILVHAIINAINIGIVH